MGKGDTEKGTQDVTFGHGDKDRERDSQVVMGKPGNKVGVEVKDGYNNGAEEPETRCGFRSCRPKGLQRCNNPICLCICLSLYTLVHGFAVNGVNNVNTTAYERRFDLSSSSVGWISSSFDIAAAACGIIIGFYGNRRNKGRLLTISFVISAVGSICMCLPHFLTDKYEWGQGTKPICSYRAGLTNIVSLGRNLQDNFGPQGIVPTTDACTSKDTTLSSYLAFLLAGQLMHGVGGSTLLTVGYSFIDDSVPATSSPLYLAAINLCQMLGPMVGYLLGGALLTVYVDADTVPRNQWGLRPTDPRWVGAWWVGFAISGILKFFLAIPFACFGSELPTAKHVRDTRVSETHDDGRPLASLPGIKNGMSLRHFPAVTCRLLRNPAIMCVSFATAFAGLVTVALATFIPKYIQNTFGTSASTSAMYAGLVVPGAALGQVFGGFVIRRWKLQVSSILKFAVTMLLLAIIGKVCFFITCPADKLVGWNTQYRNSSESLPALTSWCNDECRCDRGNYHMVCDSGGAKYFSPCLAGCTRVEKHGSHVKFTRCNCLASGDNVTSVSMDNCDANSCGSVLYIFIIIILISAFTVSSVSVPALTAILRCAHDSERTYALGFLNFITRAFGTIPGPILYGAVIDSSCTMWGSRCGNKSTSCWLYNNAKMGQFIGILSIGFTALSASFFFLAFKLYRAPVDPKKEHVTDLTFTATPAGPGDGDTSVMTLTRLTDDTGNVLDTRL